MLAAIVAGEAGEQNDADYKIRKGLVLKDEVARFFRIGRALHEQFSATRTPSPEATVAHVAAVLREVFEFADVAPAPARQANDRRFAIALEAGGGRVPVAVATPAEGLETPSPRLALDGRRTSAASTVQDWLDATDAATWGIATDGLVIRILRDNASLTRPAYIDVDLGRMFEAEALGDFTAAWLLMHASRFGDAGVAPMDCPIERWRAASTKQGEVARDRLRGGVEDALASLGTGFLEHPDNATLRDAASARPMAVQALFAECLQVVYRLIFLFAAEDRELLHPPTADTAARALYADGYSMSSLRTRAARRGSYDAHHDLWEGVTIVFDMLTGEDEAAAARAAKLGLPVLGGLFSEGALALLDGARLSNRRLMAAVRRLAWLDGEAGMVPVNWRDMETEELGSVYEGLLELTPILSDDGRTMTFAVGDETKGNQRKTTGSYYTPDSLVQALLDSALDPVLDRAEREATDPVTGLLKLTVIDPACGSGHFLLAAARRIAMRVSRLRGGGVADRIEFRHAMRDVVRRCIHGVDRNPMAIELAKVALWIETVDPGKPLGFLDSSIRCGDSLLGVFDRAQLLKGVPDAAYRPLTGDDKKVARDLERRNANERDAQGELGLNGGASALPPAFPLIEAASKLRSMPEETMADVAERRRAFGRVSTPGRALIQMACDIHVAAFLVPKRSEADIGDRLGRVPTTRDVVLVYDGHQVEDERLLAWVEIASQNKAFHWFLEFPDVIDRGGFDVVVGNPPWERMKLEELQFFAKLDPEVATAKDKAARKRLIQALGEAVVGTQRRDLHVAFEQAKRDAEAASAFVRVGKEEGGRFPLSGRGDVNMYALFTELFSQLASDKGRAGAIVPTGIATDATTSVFFASLVRSARLVGMVDFENRDGIFPSVHRSYKFCIMTIGQATEPMSFAFFLADPAQMRDPERRFTLSAADIARINPNTKTAPVFRSRADADLVKRIYDNNPVLIDETRGSEGNPWHVKLRTMLHKTNASSAGDLKSVTDVDQEGLDDWAPVHEGDYGHQYDHRYGTFAHASVEPSSNRRMSPDFEPNFELLASREACRKIFERWGLDDRQGSLIGFRRVARSTDERTVIATALPKMPMTYGWILVLAERAVSRALLLANFNSLVFDYCLRSALSQPSIPQGVFEQTAIIPPSRYTKSDKDFVISRVIELSYTSRSMTPFARELEYEGDPYPWNEARRAELRAELDALFARLYGLSRDDLRFILDPTSVRGPNYPSETFRVLREGEIGRFKEYRTERLVLAAWDRQESLSVQAAAE